MDNQKIGNFLKKLRNEKGLTQEQLAEKLNTSSRAVSRWETGRNMPDLAMLITVSDFYSVDIKELIDGEKKEVTMNTQENEINSKIADYSREREKWLIRKLMVIITAGLIAWVVSFVFMLWFASSAQGAGFILICETTALVIYGSIMLNLKINQNSNGISNTVIGASISVSVINIVLLMLFFGSGNYHNHGLIAAVYVIIAISVVFILCGIITLLINRKRTEEKL